MRLTDQDAYSISTADLNLTKEQRTVLEFILKEAEENKQRIAELEVELSKHQESSFHPDWSLLQASQESLREHMGTIKRLDAALAQVIATVNLELEARLHEEYCPHGAEWGTCEWCPARAGE